MAVDATARLHDDPSKNEYTMLHKDLFEEHDSDDGYRKLIPENEIRSPSRHAKRFWRLLRSPIVFLFAGPSEEPFQIHRDLLCYRSLFFVLNLATLHSQEEQDVIRLPETDELCFSVFAEWLYTGDECDPGEILREIQPVRQGEEERDNTGTDQYDDFMLLFKCYVLGAKLRAPRFQACMLKETRYLGEHCNPRELTAEHIRYAYENTSRPDDPLRRFCVKMKCSAITVKEAYCDKEFMDLFEEGGPLVKDVMREYARKELRQTVDAVVENLKQTFLGPNEAE